MRMIVWRLTGGKEFLNTPLICVDLIDPNESEKRVFLDSIRQHASQPGIWTDAR